MSNTFWLLGVFSATLAIIFRLIVILCVKVLREEDSLEGVDVHLLLAILVVHSEQVVSSHVVHHVLQRHGLCR